MSDVHASFQSLGLPEPVLRALEELGYEAPTPIQAQSIPPLLAGHDILGQAQTGTGKTAAFALPLLARLDSSRTDTQLLVLAPTRELALQVAEAFQAYARHLPDFHVLPIYGGQDYGVQLKHLRRGAQVVVGTPGRVMDHMRRGTLKLDALQGLVLDEADEMLRMGFIEDVEWILSEAPPERQVALFSATMPDVIRRIARSHLREPREIKIAATQMTQTIRQRYWRVSGLHKLDALTRLLEVEDFDAMLVFVRTKTATVELAEKLTARGYRADALNGDIPQHLRERIVDRLKNGQLDIVVATDVAARGLDVERVSHVINYDLPSDPESYVHRIGRTGRAGRSGEAVLFITPREQHLLRTIERTTRLPIEPMSMPSAGDVNQTRIARFKRRIDEVLASEDLEPFQSLLAEYQQEQDADPLLVAAALAKLVQGEEPFLLDETPPARERHDRPERQERPRREPRERTARGPAPDVPMERYRLEVGYAHKVKPGNIVGAIANEAEIDSRYIGRIDIQEEYSTIDLPEGMPKELLQHLRKVRVCGRKIELKRIGAGDSQDGGGQRPAPSRKPSKPGKPGKPGKPRGKPRQG